MDAQTLGLNRWRNGEIGKYWEKVEHKYEGQIYGYM